MRHVLADGAWWATVEGRGKAVVTLDADTSSRWQHRVSSGRGEASIEGNRLILEPTPPRSIFRFSMPPAPPRAIATLASGDVQAVRLCPAEIPSLPASGALDVTGDRDGWFGDGWHLAERAGPQRFRWSSRRSTLLFKIEEAAPIRMMLRMRAASKDGATVKINVNGAASSSCSLPAGAWTDCRIDIPESGVRTGINQIAFDTDTFSPAAETRPASSARASPGPTRTFSTPRIGSRACWSRTWMWCRERE